MTASALDHADQKHEPESYEAKAFKAMKDLTAQAPDGMGVVFQEIINGLETTLECETTLQELHNEIYRETEGVWSAMVQSVKNVRTKLKAKGVGDFVRVAGYEKITRGIEMLEAAVTHLDLKAAHETYNLLVKLTYKLTPPMSVAIEKSVTKKRFNALLEALSNRITTH